MSYTNVRSFTDEQLLKAVEESVDFKGIPEGYWFIGVRSTEDAYNIYDDKFYLFKGRKFIMVVTGTTHSGAYGLKNFFKWDKRGTAIIRSGKMFYNVLQKSDGKKVRHHKGKMQCLRLIGKIDYFRDNNLDEKIDEVGTIYYENCHTNFHCNTYEKTWKKALKWIINGWSTGCMVINDIINYYKWLDHIPYDHKVSFIILKEENI